MAELFISSILVNGVGYLITAINVMNTIRFYTEVQNKVSYIWIRQPPTKKQVIATMTILNQTTEVTGNIFMIYDGVNNKDSKNNKTYNKQKNKKLNSHASNINMVKKNNKMYKSMCDFASNISIYREQRREARRERSKRRLFEYKKRIASEKDKEDQAKMNQLGFIRCEKFCKYYTHPATMLLTISDNATKKATLSKKYTPDEIDELAALILNKGSRTARKEEDFDKFKHVFLYVEIRCANCGNIHGDTIDGERVFEPATICRLQKAQIDLIYERNLDIILFEHDVNT